MRNVGSPIKLGEANTRIEIENKVPWYIMCVTHIPEVENKMSALCQIDWIQNLVEFKYFYFWVCTYNVQKCTLGYFELGGKHELIMKEEALIRVQNSCIPRTPLSEAEYFRKLHFPLIFCNYFGLGRTLLSFLTPTHNVLKWISVYIHI